MNTDTPHFWPQDPGRKTTAVDEPSPEDILRDAARELGPATGDEVIAELRTRGAGEWLEHDFYLVSPKARYRHLLFRARHRLGFPVVVFDHQANEGEAEYADRPEFERALQSLFKHPITQKIVGQIRSLSHDAP
jgi:hypothetical protein